MNINIKEKIEQINKEPQNVRMRYVWGCVAASMSIIFIVWGFSIVSMFANNEDDNKKLEIGKQMQELREQAASLKGLNNQSINDINEGLVNQSNTPDSASSQENTDSAIPKSNSYSEMFNPNANIGTEQ